ncbi:MAG: tetratricopeptide repeat protein [Cytophagaceae bacterium]
MLKQLLVFFCLLLFFSLNSYGQEDFVNHTRLADDLRRGGQFDLAITEYDKAIRKSKKRNPDLYLLHLNRGICKSRTGDFFGAKTDLDMSVRLKPDHTETYLFRGTLARLLKNDQEALNDFSKAVELEPDNYFAHLYKADLYYEFKDFENAIICYSTVLQLRPEFSAAYIKRADVYFILQKYDEAIKDYSKAISIQPESGEAYFMRGLCKSMLSEEDTLGACEDFRHAKSLGRNTNVPGINLYCNSSDLEN